MASREGLTPQFNRNTEKTAGCCSFLQTLIKHRSKPTEDNILMTDQISQVQSKAEQKRIKGQQEAELQKGKSIQKALDLQDHVKKAIKLGNRSTGNAYTQAESLYNITGPVMKLLRQHQGFLGLSPAELNTLQQCYTKHDSSWKKLVTGWSTENPDYAGMVHDFRNLLNQADSIIGRKLSTLGHVQAPESSGMGGQRAQNPQVSDSAADTINVIPPVELA